MATLRAYGRYNPWQEYPQDGDRSTLLLLSWAGDSWFPEACLSMPWSLGTAIGALWQTGLSLAELHEAYPGQLTLVAERDALQLVGWN